MPIPQKDSPKKVAVYSEGKPIRVFEGEPIDSMMRNAEMVKAEFEAEGKKDVQVKVISQING